MVKRNEIFVPVEGYAGDYFISDTGTVISVKRDKINGEILKPCADGGGYLYVTFHSGKKKDRRHIHRLVAEHFLEKTNKEINHKDANRQNNRVENLEFVSTNENSRHAMENGRKTNRAKLVIRDDGRIYGSISEAARANNISESVRISEVCNGYRKSYKGRTYRFL